MSKVKYVYPYKNTGKWITQINYNSKNYTLGIFASPEEAAQVRKDAETAKNNGTFPEFFTKLRPGAQITNNNIKRCVVCGKEFESRNGRLVCGPECKKERLRTSYAKANSKNVYKKDTVKHKYLHLNSFGRWEVNVYRDGTKYYLGSYSTLEDALSARDSFTECVGSYAEKAKEIRSGALATQAQKWCTGYKHAQEFYNLNGDLLVPCSYVCPDGYKLGQWIRSQRSARKGNSYAQITPERVEMLDKIGMVWEAKKIRDTQLI